MSTNRENFLSNCEEIEKYCSNVKSEANDNLKQKCSELVESLTFLDDEIVETLKFETIPFNGFSQFIQVLTAFTDLIVGNIRKRNKVDPDLVKLFDVIFAYKQLVANAFDLLKNQESQDTLCIQKSTVSSKLAYSVLHLDERTLAILFSSYIGFWLDEPIRKFVKFASFGTAFFSRLPCSSLSAFTYAQKGKYFVRALKESNLDYPFSIYHIAESSNFIRFQGYLKTRKYPVKSDVVNVPKQARYILDYKGNILDFDKLTQEERDAYSNDSEEQQRQKAPGKRFRNDKETIKCKYIYITSQDKIMESKARIEKKKNEHPDYKHLDYHSASKNVKPDDEPRTDENAGQEVNPEKILMIYIHGGGFFTLGTRAFEGSSLKYLCNSLGGINILSIDYSLTVPYPIPNQEILDVYLWAMSGKDEVKEKLGFHPKQIVLAGGSCGAFFVLSLTVTLNELNKIMETPLTLPKSLVMQYAVSSLSSMNPSKCMFAIEPLVAYHPLSVVFALYGSNRWSIGDFKKIENTDKFKEIAAKNEEFFANQEIDPKSDEKFKNIPDSSPWFMCDYRTYKNYAEYIESFYDHPFITPTLYADKDGLKDISLYLQVGDKDFFLDDNVDLAKQWKGEVHLDVFEKCIHGFMEFADLTEYQKEAFEFTIERFQQACGLL